MSESALPSTAAEEILAEVRQMATTDVGAAQAAIWNHYAPVVEFVHDPPSPGDGERARTDLIAMHQGEGVAFREVVPDLELADFEVDLEGMQLVVSSRLVGTLPDSTAMDAPMRMQYTIDRGRITKLTAHLDPAAIAALTRALTPE